MSSPNKQTATEPTPSPPLQDFFAFMGDVHSLVAVIGKVITFGGPPFADIALHIGSPWPNVVASAVFACIVELLVLLVTFEFWRVRKTLLAAARTVFLRSVIACAIAIAVYLLIWSLFVVPNDNWANRDVVGFQKHHRILAMIEENPSLWTTENLLRNFERNVTAIWTPLSVGIMQWVVLLSWLSVWGTLSFALATFVALQHRKERSPKAKGKKSKG